jgi:hypothetical protein
MPKLRTTQREAAFEAIPAAYMKASSNNTLPAHARQIMYAARSPIQEKTGDPLCDKYFTQTLLPDYMNDNPTTTANWDVVFDARGHFHEPHTGKEVPLGTMDVREYIRGADLRHAPRYVRGLFPTKGPDNRFSAVLFIEKEGFLPLFRRVHLAERYDLAIMSTKGMSVVAARSLVDWLSGQKGTPILVLHDFDKAGFSIVGTLAKDNRRYCFTNRVQVHDLGLRLADVEAEGLEPESTDLAAGDKAEANLRRNGATPEEIEFLCGGERVELNAFACRPFVRWIMRKLDGMGIKKVVPDENVLADAYRRAFVREGVRAAVSELREKLEEQVKQSGIPAELRVQVQQLLADHPRQPWDKALGHLVREELKKAKDTGTDKSHA